MDQKIILSLARSWTRLEQRLDGALSTIKGISFSEYQMLRVLADAPNNSASRVALAEAVGRTPSGITRALRPLEKLGFVETQKSERDARLALAVLTSQGQELVTDASGVLDDLATQLVEDAPSHAAQDSAHVDAASLLLSIK